MQSVAAAGKLRSDTAEERNAGERGGGETPATPASQPAGTPTVRGYVARQHRRDAGRGVARARQRRRPPRRRLRPPPRLRHHSPAAQAATRTRHTGSAAAAHAAHTLPTPPSASSRQPAAGCRPVQKGDEATHSKPSASPGHGRQAGRGERGVGRGWKQGGRAATRKMTGGGGGEGRGRRGSAPCSLNASPSSSVEGGECVHPPSLSRKRAGRRAMTHSRGSRGGLAWLSAAAMRTPSSRVALSLSGQRAVLSVCRFPLDTNCCGAPETLNNAQGCIVIGSTRSPTDLI